MNYAMCDAAGNIRCLASGEQPPAMEGLTAIEAPAGIVPAEWYAASGQLVRYPPSALAKRAARPHRRATWDNERMAWVDARPLADRKAAAWASIKAEREERMRGTFTHDGNTYDIDPVSLAGAAMDARESLIAGEPNWRQVWVLADNTTVTLTAEEMIAVARAAKEAVSALWATSQQLRGRIEAAQTPEALASVRWPD